MGVEEFVMPVCKNTKCNNVQNKLNKGGGLCKSCFRHKIDLYNNPSKELLNSTVISDINSEEKNIVDIIKQRENEIMDILEEEVLFLRKEIDHKNAIINKLLSNDKVTDTRDSKTRKILSTSSSTESCSSGDGKSEHRDNANVAEFPDGPINSDFLKWQPINLTKSPTKRLKGPVQHSNHLGEHRIIVEDSDSYSETSVNIPKNNPSNNNSKPILNSEPHLWQPNTTLIAGDSIISGLMEKRMSTNEHPVKVRPFPGARIEDFHDYLVPLLKKKPTFIIIHCGTNNIAQEPEEIVNGLLNLKSFIEYTLPAATVIISYPTYRNDNVAYSKKINLVRNFLSKLNINCICNDSITLDCLGQSQLHLNRKGSARLAMSYKSLIMHL